MQLNSLPAFPVGPAREPGTFVVLPLPLDLGGKPGTGAGAVWLGERLALKDVADLVQVSYDAAAPLLCEAAFGRLEPSLYAAALTLQAWRQGYRPLWLFGDHGLSYGPVRAAGAFERRVTAFVFDAHYDRLDGVLARLQRNCGIQNEVHQGNVATWIGCDPAVRQLVQIGVRQRIRDAELDPVPNVAVLTAAEIHERPDAAVAWIDDRLREARTNGDLITLSIDADVCDPAVQPAVDHPVPAGLLPADLLRLAVLVAQEACTIDFVELNPLRDDGERGCRAALTFLCALLVGTTPREGRTSWSPVLGRRPPKPIRAFGPYTHAVVGDGTWFQPDFVESAVLADTPIEQLVASVTAARLVESVDAVRAATSPSAPAPPIALTPSSQMFQSIRQERVADAHVECVAVSRDGMHLAVAGWDSNVYVSRMSDRDAPPLRLAGHEAWVVGCAFSPVDDRLATVSDDHTLRVWTLGDDVQREPLVCRGHDAWVKSVAWSRDGRRIATGGFDGTLAVWEVKTGALLWLHRLHPDTIWSLCWGPGDRWIGSSGELGLLRVWDAHAGTPLRACLGHAGPVERCRASADGAIWSLSRGGRLLRHPPDTEEPDLDIETGFEQTLDLQLLNGTGRVLVAGPTAVRAIEAGPPCAAIGELEAGFAVAAIAAWESRVVVAGDGGRVGFFEMAATFA